MINKSKIKARRIFRRRKRQVDDLADNANRHIDKHLFKRLSNFTEVGRFMIAWMLLVLVLIAGVVYQTRGLSSFHLAKQPIGGGVLSEGIVGTYTNPNPLFASGTVDLSAARLIFSSILQYDYDGRLVYDLAKDFTRSDNGLVYTITLRDDVLWHDGTKLTSNDVVFTYRAIQNPDTKSPYNVSWRGIVLDAPTEDKVTFTLPRALNSFPQSLTTGIVPAHILKEESYSDLRSSTFNSAPVGTGPYRLGSVTRVDNVEDGSKRQRIEMLRNDDYFKGRPHIDAIVLNALSTSAELEIFVADKRIDAAIFNNYPEVLFESNQNYIETSAPLLSGVYLFFNNTKEPFISTEVRQALVYATDVDEAISSLSYPTQRVRGPLLRSHVGYDDSIVQKEYDQAKAGELLDSLGWVVGDQSKLRTKDGQVLEFSITVQQGSDFAKVASALQSQLAEDMGIKVNIDAKSNAELQPTLLQHTYQALLYGINIGSDPDVYPYWHSSQAVNDRLNLSMYSSDQADLALEAGRTRPDIELRAVKYRPLLEAWVNDVPAIGFYQPSFFHVSDTRIYGFNPSRLNSISDRFSNVHNWKILTADLPIVDKNE